MLQALLKDRFKLAFHIEQKELDGFVLVVGKNGEKLKPSAPDPPHPTKPEDENLEEESSKPKVTKNSDGSATIQGKNGLELVRFDKERSIMHYEVSKMTMEILALRLSTCVGSGVHKIEDRTGIRGFYQVVYECPTQAPRSSAGSNADGIVPSDPQDGSSLTRSLDELGLKLEKRKVLQDVYIVDHAEEPTPN